MSDASLMLGEEGELGKKWAPGCPPTPLVCPPPSLYKEKKGPREKDTRKIIQQSK